MQQFQTKNLADRNFYYFSLERRSFNRGIYSVPPVVKRRIVQKGEKRNHIRGCQTKSVENFRHSDECIHFSGKILHKVLNCRYRSNNAIRTEK